MHRIDEEEYSTDIETVGTTGEKKRIYSCLILTNQCL